MNKEVFDLTEIERQELAGCFSLPEEEGMSKSSKILNEVASRCLSEIVEDARRETTDCSPFDDIKAICFRMFNVAFLMGTEFIIDSLENQQSSPSQEQTGASTNRQPE